MPYPVPAGGRYGPEIEGEVDVNVEDAGAEGGAPCAEPAGTPRLPERPRPATRP